MWAMLESKILLDKHVLLRYTKFFFLLKIQVDLKKESHMADSIICGVQYKTEMWISCLFKKQEKSVIKGITT